MKDLDLIVLGVLWQEPMHVYQFREGLSALPRGWWSDLGTTAWYHHFNRLEVAGSIQSQAPVQEGNRPPKKIYALTPLGERRLVDLLIASATESLEGWSLITAFLRILTPKEQEDLLQRRLSHLQGLTASDGGEGSPLQSWRQALVRAQARWVRSYLEGLRSTF